jgi:hypothetical protein
MALILPVERGRSDSALFARSQLKCAGPHLKSLDLLAGGGKAYIFLLSNY